MEKYFYENMSFEEFLKSYPDELDEVFTEDFRECLYMFHRQTGELNFISDATRYSASKEEIENFRKEWVFSTGKSKTC